MPGRAHVGGRSAGHAGQQADDVSQAAVPGRAEKASEWLEHRGGFVLIAGGALLLGLAAWKADRPAVAPLLVIFGSALLILGAFYSRIAGNVEATRDGVRVVIREIDRFADEPGLETVGEATQSLDAQRRQRLLEAFASWLAERGYVEARDAVDGVDVIACRDNEMFAAVLDTATCGVRHESVDDAALRLDRVPQLRPLLHPALVFPADCSGFSVTAARTAVRLELEVYTVSDDGRVQQLEAPYR